MAKTVLVTGGTRGIGEAICRLAGARGYRVALNYPDASQAERADVIVHEVERAGGSARAFVADVRSKPEVEAMFGEIDRSLGRISALVNNVGGGTDPVEIPDMGDAYIAGIVAKNFLSMAYCSTEAAKRMSSRCGGEGGVIVNISSTAAVYLDRPGRTIYAASKGAIESYTRGAARELADANIRVNAVRVGIIDTPTHDVRDDEMQARIRRTVPLKRAGRPEEVAATVMFLLSDQASYITGEVVATSGGR
ncbi:SDR family NAD(P)-dependent oxidoreductase [Pseudorhodoplanes sp.]|uniref:SDR family NAD(P)-dependent oxidoreductase n=1 Tax=Pseudorhodoplanes sp. TaxID=1934341 RepID=UPI003D0C7E42